MHFWENPNLDSSIFFSSIFILMKSKESGLEHIVQFTVQKAGRCVLVDKLFAVAYRAIMEKSFVLRTKDTNLACLHPALL